jgi:hypothetical protein
MLFLPDMSSPSCMPVPVFDAHPNNQDRLDRFQRGCYDKANACATSQLAAGSICSPPFPLTSPPSLDVYSFDQWTPLINSDISSDLYSGFCLGFPVSDPSFSYGTQDSVSSSPNSSYVTLTSLLTLCTVLPRTLARRHHQWHHLWGTMVYCTLLLRPCCHTVRRALSKRVRVVKISSFQLFPTNVIPFHGPSQRICLTLSLPCISCIPPLPCLGSCLRPTRRTLRTNHHRAPWTTISAPSLATLLRLPFSRRPQLSAYITLIPPKFPMFPSFQLRLRTTRPFLAPFSVFLFPLLPVRTGRSEP